MEHRRQFLALLHGRDGSPSDPEAAVALCHTTLASALDDSPLVTAEARANLAYCQLLGRGTPRDHVAAVARLRAAGNAGSARAWCLLAYCFRRGLGVSINSNEERRLFRQAADAGDSLAQARCFSHGIGCDVNGTEAVRLAHVALEDWPGCAFAQTFLGLCHDSGEGVPQDHAEAMRWYTLAAAQGHAPAQHNLGVCFDMGKAVPQDHAEAVRWYTLAAEQGYADAQYNLGVSYEDGEGVPQDDHEAMRWYTLAAEQQDTPALSELIKFIRKGRRMQISPLKQPLLFYRGMESGHPESKTMLNELMRGTFWHWTGPLRTVFSRCFYLRIHCALWCARRLYCLEAAPYLPVEIWGAVFGFLPYEPH